MRKKEGKRRDDFGVDRKEYGMIVRSRARGTREMSNERRVGAVVSTRCSTFARAFGDDLGGMSRITEEDVGTLFDEDAREKDGRGRDVRDVGVVSKRRRTGEDEGRWLIRGVVGVCFV